MTLFCTSRWKGNKGKDPFGACVIIPKTSEGPVFLIPCYGIVASHKDTRTVFSHHSGWLRHHLHGSKLVSVRKEPCRWLWAVVHWQGADSTLLSLFLPFLSFVYEFPATAKSFLKSGLFQTSLGFGCQRVLLSLTCFHMNSIFNNLGGWREESSSDV